jgi:hypothetical protein
MPRRAARGVPPPRRRRRPRTHGRRCRRSASSARGCRRRRPAGGEGRREHRARELLLAWSRWWDGAAAKGSAAADAGRRADAHAPAGAAARCPTCSAARRRRTAGPRLRTLPSRHCWAAPLRRAAASPSPQPWPTLQRQRALGGRAAGLEWPAVGPRTWGRPRRACEGARTPAAPPKIIRLLAAICASTSSPCGARSGASGRRAHLSPPHFSRLLGRFPSPPLHASAAAVALAAAARRDRPAGGSGAPPPRPSRRRRSRRRSRGLAAHALRSARARL